MTENKIGPDGFLQLSLQITHNELHGYPCATYESASTCAYQNGRTETIRPCTAESRELCNLYAQAGLSNNCFNDTTQLVCSMCLLFGEAELADFHENVAEASFSIN